MASLVLVPTLQCVEPKSDLQSTRAVVTSSKISKHCVDRRFGGRTCHAFGLTTVRTESGEEIRIDGRYLVGTPVTVHFRRGLLSRGVSVSHIETHTHPALVGR